MLGITSEEFLSFGQKHLWNALFPGFNLRNVIEVFGGNSAQLKEIFQAINEQILGNRVKCMQCDQ